MGCPICEILGFSCLISWCGASNLNALSLYVQFSSIGCLIYGILGLSCPISRYGVFNFKVPSMLFLILRFGVFNLKVSGLAMLKFNI